jgi:hypothetical protein
LSFRPKGEIYLRSLAFARDDRPWACPLASLARLARGISKSETLQFSENLREPQKRSSIVVVCLINSRNYFQRHSGQPPRSSPLSRGGGEPESRTSKDHWIPASAGMTTTAALDKVQTARDTTEVRERKIFAPRRRGPSREQIFSGVGRRLSVKMAWLYQSGPQPTTISWKFFND